MCVCVCACALSTANSMEGEHERTPKKRGGGKRGRRASSFDDGSPGDTASNRQSLSIITSRFMDLLAKTNNCEIDLNYAAQQLDVKKRRLYDVCSVICSMDLGVKTQKNLFRLNYQPRRQGEGEPEDSGSDSEDGQDMEGLEFGPTPGEPMNVDSSAPWAGITRRTSSTSTSATSQPFQGGSIPGAGSSSPSSQSASTRGGLDFLSKAAEAISEDGTPLSQVRGKPSSKRSRKALARELRRLEEQEETLDDEISSLQKALLRVKETMFRSHTHFVLASDICCSVPSFGDKYGFGISGNKMSKEPEEELCGPDVQVGGESSVSIRNGKNLLLHVITPMVAEAGYIPPEARPSASPNPNVRLHTPVIFPTHLQPQHLPVQGSGSRAFLLHPSVSHDAPPPPPPQSQSRQASSSDLDSSLTRSLSAPP